MTSPIEPAPSRGTAEPNAAAGVATPIASQRFVPIGPTTAVRRGRSPVDLLLIGAAVLAIGGVAFAVGRMTAPATAATFPGGGQFVPGRLAGPDASLAPGETPAAGGPQVGGPGLGGPGGLIRGGMSLTGTVTSVGSDSVTMTLESGEEVTVALDDATEYRTASEATVDALSVGSTVDIAVGLDGLAPGGAGDTPTLTADDVTVVP
jgi:hypothetical protein